MDVHSWLAGLISGQSKIERRDLPHICHPLIILSPSFHHARPSASQNSRTHSSQYHYLTIWRNQLVYPSTTPNCTRRRSITRLDISPWEPTPRLSAEFEKDSRVHGAFWTAKRYLDGHRINFSTSDIPAASEHCNNVGSS